MTDITGSITAAILKVVAVIRGIANPVGVLALVIIGIMWMASDNDSTIQKCKSWLVRIIIGMVIINLAQVIMDFIQKIGA